jgi:hypothetical protein
MEATNASTAEGHKALQSLLEELRALRALEAAGWVQFLQDLQALSRALFPLLNGGAVNQDDEDESCYYIMRDGVYLSSHGAGIYDSELEESVYLDPAATPYMPLVWRADAWEYLIRYALTNTIAGAKGTLNSRDQLHKLVAALGGGN